MSRTGKHQIPPLVLDELPRVSDGQWHKVELELRDGGRHVKLTVDGPGKALKSPNVPVHLFLGPKLTIMTVGGLKVEPDQAVSSVRAYGVDVPGSTVIFPNWILKTSNTTSARILPNA